ncbi:hypothetical protein ScPMuIL_000654 [Solemya velum]
MWRLKRQARHERGYRRIKFSPKKKKKLPNDTCPVCLDEFNRKENIAVCPCYHGFHVKCLMEWLRHRNTCPMCKAPVQTLAGERTGLIVPEAARIPPVSNV